MRGQTRTSDTGSRHDVSVTGFSDILFGIFTGFHLEVLCALS